MRRAGKINRYVLAILVFLSLCLLKYHAVPFLPLLQQTGTMIDRSSTALGPDALIVVACHAIYTSGPTGGEDESEWLIEPFQRGETPTFIEHIRRGVEELANSTERTLLAFSGGATKSLKTGGKVTKTEAEGYTSIAFQRDFFGLNKKMQGTYQDIRHTMFQENYATDSYQNVLLSLIQYPIWQLQLHGRVDPRNYQKYTTTQVTELVLPKRLIIISHEFKKARFLDLHIPAIRSIWPSEKSFLNMEVEYIGINPPFDEQKIREIEEGDQSRGYGVWKDDLLGTGDVLSGKRTERGWDGDAFLRTVAGHFDDNTLAEVEGLVKGSKATVD